VKGDGGRCINVLDEGDCHVGQGGNGVGQVSWVLGVVRETIPIKVEERVTAVGNIPSC